VKLSLHIVFIWTVTAFYVTDVVQKYFIVTKYSIVLLVTITQISFH